MSGPNSCGDMSSISHSITATRSPSARSSGADLVERDLVGRDAVDRGLRLRQPAEQSRRALLDLGVEAARRDQAEDLREAPMRMARGPMRVLVPMLVFLRVLARARIRVLVPVPMLVLDLHLDQRGRQPRPVDLPRLQAEAGQGELAELRAQAVEGKAEVDERAQDHVPGRARGAVEVGHAAQRRPRSFRLTKRAAPRTTWSSTSIPIRVPAAARRRVRATSSPEGSGSPEGWLWNRTSAAARATTASWNTSRGWTSDEVRQPTEITASRLRRRRTSRA